MKIQINLFPDLIYRCEYHLVLDATLYICLFLLDKLFYRVKRAELSYESLSQEKLILRLQKGLMKEREGRCGLHSSNVS